jgi:hypothetical protein
MNFRCCRFVDFVIYNYLGIQILKIVYFLQNIILIRRFGVIVIYCLYLINLYVHHYSDKLIN